LDCRLGYLVRGLVPPGIDDLHPGIPQGHSHHNDSPVMAIQAWLGQKDPYPLLAHEKVPL
jgi:hypothetical protein